MSHLIQAQLDDATNELRLELQQRLGWTDAKLITEGILALGQSPPPVHGRQQLTGVGEFDSGMTDLGSNKNYLQDLGRT